MRVNQWEISAAPKKYRLRMGWWRLTPGQQVFSLGMGRHPACSDQVLYHVARASIKIHSGHSGLASGARPSQQAPLFGWLINLDGVRVDIRGRVYSIARDGWHVFSEKVAYHVSGGPAGATETAFHPDSSRMVDQGSSTGHNLKVPLSTALVSPCTADSVGPADPGVVQWRNKIRSPSFLYSGQAPNRA